MAAEHDHDEEAHVAHDESNWLVSYADMMTLLFGFFVLMYSMSRVDEEKFTVVSRDVAQFFGGKLADDSGIKASTEDIKKYLEKLIEEMKAKGSTDRNGILLGDGNTVGAQPSDLEPEKMIEMTPGQSGLTLKFKGSILFGPASAKIKPEFEKVLTELGQKLKASQRVDQIVVEGHTDDSPIQSPIFPTNWELSAARAARIVRQFEAVGLESHKMIAEGLGSSRPEVPNLNDKRQPIPGNRAQNRRVVIKVKFTAPPKGSTGDLAKEYFERVRQSQSEPPVKVAENEERPSEPAAAPDVEKQLQEAQARLAEAQMKLKAKEEANKKQQKLADLQKKLEQINQKAQEVERKLAPSDKAPQRPAQAK